LFLGVMFHADAQLTSQFSRLLTPLVQFLRKED
jgi:hypothetical protein